ncbi:MarR family transcriptional regulator [Nonomuraea sp. 10N515B]|uniref:MarR family transcriptional regulator n=1 Tax=Nonomuraea sp. 10N515B TaxID=3457422 RepID=UPI003FCD2A35
MVGPRRIRGGHPGLREQDADELVVRVGVGGGAADLVQRLRVSPASISQTVAFLEQQGLLKRERAPGGRRERYVIDDELWVRSTLASLQMNDTLVAESQRAAEILGAATLAGARFATSGEFLLLVNATLRKVMEQWQQSQAERNAGRQS